MNNRTVYISNTINLRQPLRNSLDLFDTLVNECNLLDTISLAEKEKNTKQKSELFEAFERNFPSVCFSIATGIGKTRLMAAFLTYLVKEKNIKNFFILSPNITIYNKLIEDFGNPASSKYVFKGLPEISDNTTIITGEDYETKGIKSTSDSIQINLFNIGKINSDAKATTKDGKTLEARIKRFRETIGTSYFEFLKNLKDLVIIMDESHRYRGERGMETLNELNPLLGIELTATPIDANTNKRFKNIVFEYGLKDALKEKKYIKNPAVVTRQNTDFKKFSAAEIEKMKLHDAIVVHHDTKIAIENYCAENNKPNVKPIILVSCSDTTHAKKVYDYVVSDEFYKGEFRDKVLQIDSSTKTEEQLEKLLTLEKPENRIEIVIHVDMLKEGWDVSNLYTIVPLRAANALTLIEQTIGRGLRLPFGGKPTGDEKVDMLSIMIHDKFKEVLDAAKDENSLLNHITKRELTERDLQSVKEIVESKTKDETEIEKEEKEIEKIPDTEIKKKAEIKHKVKKAIANAVKTKIENKEIDTPQDFALPTVKKEIIAVATEEIKKQYSDLPAIEIQQIVSEAEPEYNKQIESIAKSTIYIPQIVVKFSENRNTIKPFTLNTKEFETRNWEQEMNLIRTTLIEQKRDIIHLESSEIKFPQYVILDSLKKIPQIMYEGNSTILTNLCEQAVEAVTKTLKNPKNLSDTINLCRTLIANMIYEQIKGNIEITTILESKPVADKFLKILPWHYTKEKDDNILNYKINVTAKLLTSKLFCGFSKSCHEYYKFDSIPEKDFAEKLEDTTSVEKWLRPPLNQFDIWYLNNSKRYNPDFVVETNDKNYLIEIKAENEIETEIVKLKTEAAIKYCKTATELNLPRNENPWVYVLIPANEVLPQMTFEKLIADYEKK